MTKIDDIKFYRGPEAGISAAEEGEPLFTTDTHRLFVGSNSGNVEFARKDDLGTGVSESYTASDGQTVFNTTHAFTAGAGQTKVSIDGVPQPLGTSYTEVGTNEIVLSEGVPAGAVVTIALFELTSDLGSQVSSNTAQISANTSSLAEKVQQGELVINVKNYKCSDGQYVKGDGSHDDTTGMQAAINDAVLLNGSLYLPGGTYRITSTLHLNTTSNGITIYGSGRFLSTIQNTSDSTTIDFEPSGIAKNIVMKDIGFIGVQNAVTVSSAINFKHGVSSGYTHSVKINIENISIQYGYNGITFDSVITSSFKNVIIDSCKNDGFVGTTFVTSTLFETCYCVSVGRYGYNTRASYTTFQNCACDSGGSDAYHITGGQNVSFISCDAEFLNGYAYYAASTSYVTITGSNVTTVPGNFPLIYLQDTQFVNISNIYGLYSTTATVSPITVLGTTNNINIIGGYINPQGGTTPLVSDMTKVMLTNWSSALGMGVGIIPTYGLHLYDSNNIKACFGVPGVANWYFRVNSNGYFGIAKNGSDSGSVLIQTGARDQSIVVTSTGVQIGGSTAGIASLISINGGSTTWNPSTVANNAIVSTTVTVTGASIGDQVTVGFSNALAAGLILAGNVTGVNIVTVTLLNMTGASQTISSGTLKATVIKT